MASFRHLGAKAEKVHLKQLTGDTSSEFRRSLEDYDTLMMPGGFAAGDYVRAGAILAARLRSRLSRDLVDFVDAGKAVLGICNGFQVLVEAGLLPGLGGTMTEEPEAVLAPNDSAHYECRPSLLRHENRGSCAFTRTLRRGRVVTFISAHAEGKFLLPRGRSRRILRKLQENDQIVFRYVDDRGRYAGYPWNPSGTTFNIAAICNPAGNVFGIQPHPERCFYRHLHPDWTRRAKVDPVYGDGKEIFESALRYVERAF